MWIKYLQNNHHDFFNNKKLYASALQLSTYKMSAHDLKYLLASSAADRWVEPNQTIKLVLAASPLSTLH